MIATRALVLLFALCLGLSAWCHAPPPSAPTAPHPAPGAFVDVESGKLYYEECGAGPDAVVLIHDGIAHSAVWDDVWPTFCKRFHTIRYDRRGYGVLPLQPLGRRKRKISRRSSAIEKYVAPFSAEVPTAANSRRIMRVPRSPRCIS